MVPSYKQSYKIEKLNLKSPSDMERLSEIRVSPEFEVVEETLEKAENFATEQGDIIEGDSYVYISYYVIADW